MHVTLINPPYTAEQRYGKDLSKFGPDNEPLGLAYLAAMLEKYGHTASIWDGMVESWEEGLDKIDNADLVGVTMLTPMYDVAKETIRKIRSRGFNVPIVVGGPHPTILPEETLKDIPEIDYVIKGEGEHALLKLIYVMERGWHGKQISEAPLNPNLDDFPIPARHLLPMDRYQMTKSRSNGNHSFTVIVARGCPFSCGYCSRMFGKKVRFHSPERVINEIRLLERKYDAKEINLEADTLTISPNYCARLSDLLCRHGLNNRLRFTCESRIDTVSREMLLSLKKAGVWQISYGVETGNQRLLEVIDKGITLKQIESVFRMTKKVGISIRAFYMLGLPTETREESQETIDFAKKLDARWSQFTLFTPFPGTKLYELAKQSTSSAWSDYKTHGGWTEGKLSYVPEGRTQEEMKYLQKAAYRTVYLRPRMFLRSLMAIRSWSTFIEYVDGFRVLSQTNTKTLTLVRVPRKDLENFAKGHYVDSPVYFDAAWPVRMLNWLKLQKMLSMVDDNGGMCVDLGCGNGVLLSSLSRIYDNVIGVDLHVNAAQKLIKQYNLSNVRVVKGNAYKLPMANDTADAMFATSSLEHFMLIDDVINEIDRVLKPNGKLYFLSPSENWVYQMGRKLLGYKKPADHYLSSKEIEQRLENCFTPRIKKSYPLGMSIYNMGVYQKI